MSKSIRIVALLLGVAATQAVAQARDVTDGVAVRLAELIQTSAGTNPRFIQPMNWCPDVDPRRIACEQRGQGPALAAESAGIAGQVAKEMGAPLEVDAPKALKALLPPVDPSGLREQLCKPGPTVQAYTVSRIKETVASAEWRVLVYATAVPVKRECMGSTDLMEYVFVKDQEGRIVVKNRIALLQLQTWFGDGRK